MTISPFDPTRSFRINGAQALDPITVYLEDHETGRGTLTLRCFDRAWTCYWGSMGQGATLATFMQDVDAGYIANCLIRGARAVITNRHAGDREMVYLMRICEALKAALAEVDAA